MMRKISKFRNYLIALLYLMLFFFLASDTQGSLGYAQSTAYDFISQAHTAVWRSASGDLPFPGKDTDERGFALLKQGAKMEDGSTPPIVLETHPNWNPNGWISGTYANITIPANSDLFVNVGFLNGAQESDGVSYFVKITSPNAKPVTLLNIGKTYNGKLSQMSASLADYAGKTVDIELRVNAGSSSGKDWAGWVEAKILQRAVVQAADADKDGVPDATDNCPSIANPQQENRDGDAQGDACDTCDNRDTDKDGIVNCQDACPDQPETLNGYQDQDGCPDTVPSIDNTLPDLPETPAFAEPNINWFAGILEGPIIPGAFEDGDQDGVMNFQDDCPNTPIDNGVRVYENGCFCTDTDGGANRAALMEAGYLNVRIAGGEAGYSDSCQDEDTLIEFSCNPLGETMVLPAGSAYIRSEVNCSSLGAGEYGVGWSCQDQRCVPNILPEYCFSFGGTCSDGIRNQGESGVDCGGICPPCNTLCTTGTRYAPDDTPCRSTYPDDPHEVELYYTHSYLRFACQFYEICHSDLDPVIEEATSCCSIPNSYAGMSISASAAVEEAAINAMPDPNLCRAARNLSSATGGCSRCVGLYIIKGLGEYARWMQGYTWLYPEHNTEDTADTPAETLINDFQTGVCRDYSLAVTTLLRKAGYSQSQVSNYCDGHHCYNVVRLPGDRYWHIVDTTGNLTGIVLEGLPGGYPYCTRMDVSYVCNNGSRSDGTPCDGTEVRIFDYPLTCEPGVACNKDLFSLPGFGPTMDDVYGCR